MRYRDSFMSKGFRWLSDQMGEAAGKNMRYSRGSDSVKVKAIPGYSSFDIMDADGAMVKHESRDFLIEATALILAREQVTPRAGDRITEYDGDKKYVYEVNMPGGADVWTWCGPERIRMRIHTKRIDSGSAP